MRDDLNLLKKLSQREGESVRGREDLASADPWQGGNLCLEGMEQQAWAVPPCRGCRQGAGTAPDVSCLPPNPQSPRGHGTFTHRPQTYTATQSTHLPHYTVHVATQTTAVSRPHIHREHRGSWNVLKHIPRIQHKPPGAVLQVHSPAPTQH